MPPLISFQQSHFRQGVVPVLHGIDWQVQPGEQWAITGATGSGKTMLLLAIQQQLRGQVAMVTFRESSRQLTYSHYFYQQRYHASGEDNAPTLHSFLFGTQLPNSTSQAIVDRLGLQQLLDRTLIKLSNGQTRKALIARALLKHPSLLLLDDPFGGLDAPTRMELLCWLDELMQTETQLILVTQPDTIPTQITHVLELAEGQIEWQGSHADFSARQAPTPLPVRAKPILLTAPTPADFSVAFSLANVTVRYGNCHLLEAVNWTVAQGERWALLGHNGAGKSILLSLLYGDHPQAYANQISLFDQRRGRGESVWNIKRRIGFVSPELHLYFPRHLTARQVAFTGLTDTQMQPRYLMPETEHDVLALFTYFGLETRLTSHFGTLSAGQQRLVLLVRALLKQAPCLILDEPFQCLDSATMLRAKHLIDQLPTATTLLFVTHHLNEIPESVNHLLKLQDGKVVSG